MELWDLKHQILENKLSNFYIFTGEELGIMDMYINKIAEVLKAKIVRSESVVDYINAGRIRSIVDTQKELYLIRDDKKFTTEEGMWDRLEKRRGNVILVFANIDKRGKFYKRFESRIVFFNRLDKGVLRPQIRNLSGLNNKNLDILLDCCQMDYARILLEIEKIKLFPDKNPNEVFEKFLSEGAIYTAIPDSIFKFTDAVMARDKDKSFIEYQNCVLTGEPNIRLISVLYNNFRQQIGFQLCKNPTPDNTGLTPYIINICRQRSWRYNKYELIRALTMLKDIDVGIKSGLIEESISVEYFLSEVL